MELIDLSHELRTGMMVYPGDPEVSIDSALTVASDQVNVLSLHLGSQSGTHLDSPFHVRDDFATLDRIPLERFLGRFALVDATGLAPFQPIPHERFTSVVYDGCTIVLVRTDWSDVFGDASYLQHPFPTEASLRFLLDQGVRTIGLDFLSLDKTPAPGDEGTLANHVLWSELEGIIVENLTNLRALTSATRFVSLLPLKLGASDGAPIRAVAMDGLA